MKSLLVFMCVWLMSPILGQHVVTSVDSSGLVLEVENTGADRIVIDGTERIIEIRVNDSLLLRIDGGTPASFTLLNSISGIPVGLELGADGSYALGEFSSIENEARLAIMSIRNGVFRPAPNTQSIATNFTERLRITSNGDVGIGTLSPLERLDVNGGVRIGFVPEDSALERLLVIDPQGHVRYRLVSTLPPPMGGIIALQQQNEALVNSLDALTQRVTLLEKLDSSGN